MVKFWDFDELIFPDGILDNHMMEIHNALHVSYGGRVRPR